MDNINFTDMGIQLAIEQLDEIQSDGFNLIDQIEQLDQLQRRWDKTAQEHTPGTPKAQLYTAAANHARLLSNEIQQPALVA